MKSEIDIVASLLSHGGIQHEGRGIDYGIGLVMPIDLEGLPRSKVHGSGSSSSEGYHVISTTCSIENWIEILFF